MDKHPYLRAYLAGIAVPTVFLLVVMTAYTLIRYVYDVPIAVEKVIVFPMAAVPNAWGLWNVLYLAFVQRRHFSLGVFGGVLPLLLAPGGYAVITTPNIDGFQARLFGKRWRSAIADHVALFSRSTLIRVVAEEGFAIQQSVTWGGLAVGTAPTFLKNPVDKMAKRLGFGDVVMVLATKR